MKKKGKKKRVVLLGLCGADLEILEGQDKYVFVTFFCLTPDPLV